MVPKPQQICHTVTLTPAWIGNYIFIKCEMTLLIRSQTSTVQPLQFGNGQVISCNTSLSLWLLIHAGIKVNSYWWTGPKCEMILLIRSQTSTVQPLQFGNGQVISCNTSLSLWLLIHAGIKVNSYWWTGPKCEMILLIRSQTSTVQPLQFGNGQVISCNTSLSLWLLIHAGIKVNSYWWKGPQ